MNKPRLSIVILNHNTKELLQDCLKSLEKVKDEINFEVIISDNASTDGSPEIIQKKFSWIKYIEGLNVSFSNGNNRARNIVKGEFILLLNSDTLVHKNTLLKTVNYLEEHEDVGVVTCKLVLPNGKLDKDARRRFPTPWISFRRLFLKNTQEYWYEDIDENTTHEVDSVEGAFLLTRKTILDKVNWLDENYLFDGEDLDLCFNIKKLGYKIVYFPEVSITHVKGATRNKIKSLTRKMQGVDSMEYFYKKNLWNNYPLIFNYFVLVGIKFLKLMRFIQMKLQ
ncbi:MAG TPA: glycosyltransferase family 2 protein [Alphaproteobacteria bacterium]|jgi:GT2 family glycosyltransferase|nr:glycosyltransferase family 2 protein [Alphaproteobacteria bacterium]